jgi:glycosyltransferase involved in cell wall biosynthesis
MKLLCIIQCTNLGGMEQYMLLLLQEFRKMNIEIEVISLNPLGDLASLLDQEEIPAHGVNYRGVGGWGSFWELRRLLKTIQADGMLMIGHNLMASIAIGNRWKQHRSLSIHYHHKGVKPLWQWRLIYAIAALQFRTVVFVSDFIMREALEIAPFLKSRARMVGSLYHVHERGSEEARVSVRKRLDLPTNARIVGNAGWLIARKRWDIFLDVAARVFRAEPQTIFLIAGEGPESAALKQKAESFGIAKNVVWLGWQKSLVDFYQVIDVLLFNSDLDAQGRTPLDAMSYGIPVVASILQGGAREIIQDESVGILIETHDLETLARWVVRFLREPELAAKVGAQGRRRIHDYGDPQRHAVRILESMGLKAPAS